jgi:hypothetical protein
MYEHRGQRLLSRVEFAQRVFSHFVLASVALSLALGMGVIGYHFIAKLGWVLFAAAANAIVKRQLPCRVSSGAWGGSQLSSVL